MNRWPVKKLGELCDVRIGRTPRRNNPDYWGGTAVWVTVRELNNNRIISSKENISDKAVKECMPQPIPTDTLLFSFKLSIGKMAISGCPLYTNEAIAALPIKNKNLISLDYLRYVLLTKTYYDASEHAAKGKLLNKEKVKNIDIPVPPKKEQERIVKFLNEADELRKLRAQADQRTTDLIPALFHEMFGDPVRNTKKWLAKTVDEICELVRGSSPRPKSNTCYSGGPIPRLMIEDITRD